MKYEEKVCNFKQYAKQTLDLMVDAYKWKTMAKYCDNDTMKEKYMSVSDTLFNMFMTEHENMKNIFSKE